MVNMTNIVMLMMIIMCTVNDEYVKLFVWQPAGGSGGPEGTRRNEHGWPLVIIVMMIMITMTKMIIMIIFIIMIIMTTINIMIIMIMMMLLYIGRSENITNSKVCKSGIHGTDLTDSQCSDKILNKY